MTVREFEQVTINALKEGNKEAFNLCFDLFYGVLCLFAKRLVGDLSTAEDIVQGVFVDLWIKRENISAYTSVKTYLFLAVKSDCFDFLQHKKVEQRYIDKVRNESPEEAEQEFTPFLEDDLQLLINTAVKKMPEQCSKIFYMSRFRYMSYKAIADELNISPKTVDNQIGKALKIVRQALDEFL